MHHVQDPITEFKHSALMAAHAKDLDIPVQFLGMAGKPEKFNMEFRDSPDFHNNLMTLLFDQNPEQMEQVLFPLDVDPTPADVPHETGNHDQMVCGMAGMLHPNMISMTA